MCGSKKQNQAVFVKKWLTRAVCLIIQQILVNRLFVGAGVFGNQRGGVFRRQPRRAQILGQRLPVGGFLFCRRFQQQHELAALAVVIFCQPRGSAGDG